MKAKWLFFYSILFLQIAHAQETICANKEKQLGASILENDFKKANDLWKEVKTLCPTQSENIYALGKEVLEYNIQLAPTESKTIAVKELLNLYDLYDKSFPNNTNGNFIKRAMVLYDNKAGSTDEIFLYLDKGFTKQKESFTNSQALYTYFDLYYKKYQESNSGVTLEQLLEKYSAVLELVQLDSKKIPSNKEEYERVVLGINSLIAEKLTPENLIPYCKSNFERNKSNVSWLETYASCLSVNCKNTPILGQIAQQFYDLSPNATSATVLANYFLNTNKLEKAVEYFTIAVSLSKDKNEKADMAYVAATVLVNIDKSKAKEMILTAIENNTTNGRYYLFLGDLYANSVNECATSVLEKEAIYKLASETFLKAGKVEPRLKATSEGMAKEYIKNSTSTKASKTNSVKIGCWINETVQL